MNDVTDQLASKLEDRINQCLDGETAPERQLHFTTTTNRPSGFLNHEPFRENHLDKHLVRALKEMDAPAADVEFEFKPLDSESDWNRMHMVRSTIHTK